MLAINPNLTGETIFEVQWLDRIDNDGATPIGSGVVVRVAVASAFTPLHAHAGDPKPCGPISARDCRHRLTAIRLAPAKPMYPYPPVWQTPAHRPVATL